MPVPAAILATILFAALPSAAVAQVKVLSNSPDLPNPLAPPPLPDPIAKTAPVSLSLMQGSEGKLGDEKFQPEVGQAGKDVIWVPTPDSLVKAMLTVAEVKPDDFVVDLGAGDGKIAIAAARDFGARAQGIEYNPDMVALARRNAQRAGVANKVTFVQGDIFQTDFTDATVVTMYLLPSLNLKLRDTILKMKPGTRVASHAFTMGEWEADRTINTDDATGYFWIVPANIAGRWAFEVGNDRFAAELGQQFQKLTIARGGPIRDGQVKGTRVVLSRANGQELEGEIRSSAAPGAPFVADSMVGRGWVATRIRPAG